MGVQSGYTWEADPEPDRLGGPGRTRPVDVRAVEDHAIRGKLKMSPDPSTREVYSIGMERVALTLGRMLGLPIPDTLVRDCRWTPRMRRQARAERTQLGDGRGWHPDDARRRSKRRHLPPWLRLRYLDGEPRPRGAKPRGRAPSFGVRHANALSSRIWLIDHGATGLWFPSHFDQALNGLNDTELVDVGDGAAHKRGALPPRPDIAAAVDASFDVRDAIVASRDDLAAARLAAVEAEQTKIAAALEQLRESVRTIRRERTLFDAIHQLGVMLDQDFPVPAAEHAQRRRERVETIERERPRAPGDSRLTVPRDLDHLIAAVAVAAAEHAALEHNIAQDYSDLEYDAAALGSQEPAR